MEYESQTFFSQTERARYATVLIDCKTETQCHWIANFQVLGIRYPLINWFIFYLNGRIVEISHNVIPSEE